MSVRVYPSQPSAPPSTTLTPAFGSMTSSRMVLPASTSCTHSARCSSGTGKGVRAVVILDGRVPNACLLELFTEHGAGSLIRSAELPPVRT